MAASKFDLTGEPYDLIIRVSLQKPAWMRRAYWPGTARHYRVAVMTRASQKALSAPGIRLPRSWLRFKGAPSEQPDLRFAVGR